MHPVLETRGLTIRFGGHVAVNAVSCRFEPGTLTAIVGPERRGQDHLLQPDFRPVARELGTSAALR
jgi:ABC-type branched-subunit amino acid transport system ATPase component